ncbi:head-tail connector protein [Pelagibacterium flavum]|uniref:Head-tail connector protein n=1 Tax=Pelagibacterium flavum TaxID=2984530 RepID=A0ABY6IJ76_9HYPH|nr:head-tail connector protein [Pelagibacterium sp. YIM 151497]UYQ70652.1 head-tail connector protein [Pelagibacterium sp. YIM 151497]
MELITVAAFKAHARIDGEDQDSAITAIVDAANAHVAGFLDIAEDDVPTYEPPADVKQATLLIASHWFENREDSFPGTIHEVPLDAHEVLLNHRGWAF